LGPGTISANIYEGVPEISTIQVHALMIVNETMDEKPAYQITAALWSQRTLAMLREGHPQGGRPIINYSLTLTANYTALMELKLTHFWQKVI
jgi:hypothetical protein